MTLLFTQGHNCVPNLQMFNLYYNSHIPDNMYALAFKLGMTVDLCKAYLLMLVSMTL